MLLASHRRPLPGCAQDHRVCHRAKRSGDPFLARCFKMFDEILILLLLLTVLIPLILLRLLTLLLLLPYNNNNNNYYYY